MSLYELLESMKVYFHGDMKAVIESANEFVADMEKDPKGFMNRFSNAIEGIAEQEDICPICGSQLVELETNNEDRGEYAGSPVAEKVATYCCDSCNYIQD